MPYITHEVFVRAWVTSKSIAEISRKTGLERHQIIYKGKYLREKGVRLPKLKERSAQRTYKREGIDVDMLNNLILAAKAGKL